HRDFEHPDHPQQLLMQRKNAREQMLYKRFFSLNAAVAARIIFLNDTCLLLLHDVLSNDKSIIYQAWRTCNCLILSCQK
ncbi:MAG: hypothetical protein JW795_08295, partial [Chitinivibrionales bacterium]|nr:hypothetical protein [Chitinivibrionales bacterium]